MTACVFDLLYRACSVADKCWRKSCSKAMAEVITPQDVRHEHQSQCTGGQDNVFFIVLRPRLAVIGIWNTTTALITNAGDYLLGIYRYCRMKRARDCRPAGHAQYSPPRAPLSRVLPHSSPWRHDRRRRCTVVALITLQRCSLHKSRSEAIGALLRTGTIVKLENWADRFLRWWWRL